MHSCTHKQISSIFMRDSIYAIARICHGNSVCLSVPLSVTRAYCIKMAERIIEILSLSERPINPVFFVTKGHCVNLRASPPTGAPNTRGGCNCRPICSYISETVRDRGMVTMEDEYKVVCALSHGAILDDLEWPRTSVSRSHYSLKANISQTVHPIHSMFGPRLGFSGSADRMALFAVR